jgi:glucose/arabinose dehydrogenase
MGAGFRWLGRIAVVLAGAAAFAVIAAPAGAALHAARLGTFDTPVYPVQAPGELGRLFVVEQGGRIELIDHGTTLPKPFLDISGRVLAPNDPDGGGEQGLLSVAFPPNYQTTRRFYVYYTNNDSSIEVDEFKRLAGNRDRADPNSRRQVIVIPHPTFTNHNGGTIRFGPDGSLYMATGDGGGVAKIHGRNARDLQSLLGKVLRIDPLPRAGKPYTVPRDNPYVGRPGRDEIYAYGLRNPFRFSFDRGRIAIGDVGQNSWEEVDILPTGDVNGVNFGWPAWEGNHAYTGAPGPDPPTFPIFEYPHHPACAVIGGVVVRDPDLLSLDGRYLYGDRCVPDLRSLIPVVSSQQAVGGAPIGVSAPELTGINAGLNGHVYFTAGDGAFRLTESP